MRWVDASADGGPDLVDAPFDGPDPGGDAADGADTISVDGGEDGAADAPADGTPDAPGPDAAADAPADRGLDGAAHDVPPLDAPAPDGPAPDGPALDGGGDAAYAAAACGNGRIEAVQTDVGTTVNAYVRPDGAILLAHYAPGTRINDYDPSRAQMSSASGTDRGLRARSVLQRRSPRLHRLRTGR